MPSFYELGTTQLEVVRARPWLGFRVYSLGHCPSHSVLGTTNVEAARARP